MGMNSFKKATLVKRHICVKDPMFKQLSDPDVLQKSEYSCMCFAIEEGKFSGEGEEKTWYMIVYYEPSKKKPKWNALSRHWAATFPSMSRWLSILIQKWK